MIQIKLDMQPLKSLHSLVKENGIPVYNPFNAFIGVTTGYTAQARNGKDIGEIEIARNGEKFWIRGYGVYIVGFGIKWIEEENV